MNVTGGWFLFVGGVIGAVRILLARKFHQSDFANLDGVITEKQHKTEIRVTLVQRVLLIIGCILLAAIGAYLIEKNHNWNPFKSSTLNSQSFLCVPFTSCRPSTGAVRVGPEVAVRLTPSRV
jgi:hypothetical protein